MNKNFIKQGDYTSLAKHLFAASIVLCTFIFPLCANAESAPTANDIAAEKILKENEKKLIYGPATINLGDQGTISIRYGEAYIPVDVLGAIFKVSGQPLPEGTLGMIFPGIPGLKPPKDEWGGVIITFNKMGYVKDDDAKNWNYSRILDSFNNNRTSKNEQRQKQGLPRLIR